MCYQYLMVVAALPPPLHIPMMPSGSSTFAGSRLVGDNSRTPHIHFRPRSHPLLSRLKRVRVPNIWSAPECVGRRCRCCLPQYGLHQPPSPWLRAVQTIKHEQRRRPSIPIAMMPAAPSTVQRSICTRYRPGLKPSLSLLRGFLGY